MKYFIIFIILLCSNLVAKPAIKATSTQSTEKVKNAWFDDAIIIGLQSETFRNYPFYADSIKADGAILDLDDKTREWRTNEYRIKDSSVMCHFGGTTFGLELGLSKSKWYDIEARDSLDSAFGALLKASLSFLKANVSVDANIVFGAGLRSKFWSISSEKPELTSVRKFSGWMLEISPEIIVAFEIQQGFLLSFSAGSQIYYGEFDVKSAYYSSYVKYFPEKIADTIYVAMAIGYAQKYFFFRLESRMSKARSIQFTIGILF